MSTELLLTWKKHRKLSLSAATRKVVNGGKRSLSHFSPTLFQIFSLNDDDDHFYEYADGFDKWMSC